MVGASRTGGRYEGWISSKILLPHDVEGTAEGFKKAPIELNETFEEIWAKGVDPDDYKSPYLYNPEDPHNKLKKEQQDALDAVKSNYDRNKPVPLRIG